MRNFKRVMCAILSLVLLMPTLVGCVSKKTDDTIYLTKGEFFAYYVYENELSSNKYTADEVLNCDDGSVEADIIVEWGYLPEDLATKNLKQPVSREIVVMVCAKGTDDLKVGNTADIKDADLLKDPQLIADAYASGFFELENGYFDGAEKMSLAACEQVLEKAREYTANFHFEANKVITETAEGVIEQDISNYKEGDVVIEFVPAETEETEGTEGAPRTSGDAQSPRIVPLGCASEEVHTVTLNNDPPLEFGFNNQMLPKEFLATIDKEKFEGDMKNPEVGDAVVIKAFQMVGQIVPPGKGEILGILMSKKLIGDKYSCIFRYPQGFEEAVEKKTVKNGNGHGIDVGTFVKEKTEVAGWKLEFEVSGSSVKVAAEKDFTVHETGRKQDWQNSKKTVTAKATLEMSNFNLDIKNLKSFANKKGNGYLKLTCDTDVDCSLSTSLRYTPDSNRNGKFPSNWNNSRWTDKDSKGAKTIKIAKFSPTLYECVTIDVYIYALITFDGKLTFKTSIDNGGMKISTNDGKIKLEKLGNKSSEVSANFNMHTRFGVEATLRVFSFIKVITYDVGANFDLHAQVDLFYEDKLSKAGVYADEEGLSEYAAEDDKFTYCIDGTVKISFSGELKDSGVKMILDYVNKGSSLNFEKPIWSGGRHFEDGAFVDKCTRGDAEKEEEKLEETEDDVELSAYKISMVDGTCTEVLLTAIPKQTANLLDSKNSITVKSKNNKVVKATYNKKRKAIILEAAGEGSTEIVITAKKGHLWWKKTVKQEISVTVGSQDSFDKELFYIVVDPVVLSSPCVMK